MRQFQKIILSQNETPSSQNETISKEKESAKEKENKILTREEKKKTASPNVDLINRLFFMNTISPADKPAIPANTGY